MHRILEFADWTLGEGPCCTERGGRHLETSEFEILMRLRSLKRDVIAMQRLRSYLWNHGEQVSRLDGDEVVDRVFSYYRVGRLHVCNAASPGIGGAGGGGASAAPPPAPAAEPPPAEGPPSKPQKTKTWIEIKLIDEEEQPVPGEKYRIVMPDGSTREGTLNSQGGVRFDDIDEGNCEVIFPDLDGGQWRAA